jgi:hypothetical protein
MSDHGATSQNLRLSYPRPHDVVVDWRQHIVFVRRAPVRRRTTDLTPFLTPAAPATITTSRERSAGVPYPHHPCTTHHERSTRRQHAVGAF